MAQVLQKQRIVGNPGRRRKYNRNPGEILGLALAGNPGGKKKRMAKKRNTAKRHASGRGRRKSYKRNPGQVRHHATKHRTTRRYKRNAGGGPNMGGVVTIAGSALVSAFVTKLGTQMVLGDKNTGVMGYAGNLGVGAALWFVASKFLRSHNVAVGVLTGTVIQVMLRALNDYTPLGSYVSQLGMGDYQMQSFVTPQVLVAPMNNADIAVPPGWGAPAALPPPTPAQTMTASAGVSAPGGGGGNPSGAGMSGLYGGGWGGGLYG